MTEKKDGGQLQKAVPGERLIPFLKQMLEEEQGEMSLYCCELLVNQLLVLWLHLSSGCHWGTSVKGTVSFSGG